MKHAPKIVLALLLCFSAIGFSACAREVLREEVSMRVGTPAWMVKREIDAGPFHLMAFEKIHEREAPVTLYIEGDGKAHSSRSRAFFDATPVNPVSLHLSSRDNGRNVAYLARPCQYTQDFVQTTPEAFCGGEYWTDGKEYSPEVLKAYNDVLDGMKRRYGLTSFHLVGFDGGATIASALAGERKDVLSLRTVAGDFHTDVLKPQISALRFIPQHHYIGGADIVTPPANLHNYLQAVGNSQCVTYTMVQEAEHEKGWVEKWPELLADNAPECNMPPPDVQIVQKPKPVYSPRRTEDFKK